MDNTYITPIIPNHDLYDDHKYKKGIPYRAVVEKSFGRKTFEAQQLGHKLALTVEFHKVYFDPNVKYYYIRDMIYTYYDHSEYPGSRKVKVDLELMAGDQNILDRR